MLSLACMRKSLPPSIAGLSFPYIKTAKAGVRYGNWTGAHRAGRCPAAGEAASREGPVPRSDGSSAMPPTGGGPGIRVLVIVQLAGTPLLMGTFVQFEDMVYPAGTVVSTAVQVAPPANPV